MTHFRHAVGRALRMHREIRGIPLAEMAEKCGFASVSGWSRVETGSTTPTVEHVYAAAACMGIPANHILKVAEEALSSVNPDVLDPTS